MVICGLFSFRASHCRRDEWLVDDDAAHDKKYKANTVPRQTANTIHGVVPRCAGAAAAAERSPSGRVHHAANAATVA